MFRKFAQSRSGNFAILSGLAIVPLCLAAGLAIDYSRHLSAQRHLQEMVDATSLSLAASREKDKSKLELLATDFLNANQNRDRVQNLRLEELKSTDDDVDIDVSGSIPTTFMALAGYETLAVRASALAERAVNGQVEVALILDNTWSMSESDHTGESRISALKAAASKLIDELLGDNGELVRIGIVPYADYVNVGTHYRNAPWMNVEPDRDVPRGSPRECETRTTRDHCIETAPSKTCTRVVDGLSENYECGGQCVRRSDPVATAPYQHCTGGYWTEKFRFEGCVPSRVSAGARLTIAGTERYTGLVQTSQTCLNPIVRLTNDRALLKKSVNDLIIQRSGYRPYTYIPAGILWGWNVLDPVATFADGKAYDAANERPRKVAVIMTDGENTLRFEEQNNHDNSRKYGMHVGTSGSAKNKSDQLAKTNADTRAICSNMKAANIELFTVAFMVNDTAAKKMLEDCSSDPKTHFFDARDNQALLAAFENIGNSLRVVRLAR